MDSLIQVRESAEKLGFSLDITCHSLAAPVPTAPATNPQPERPDLAGDNNTLVHYDLSGFEMEKIQIPGDLLHRIILARSKRRDLRERPMPLGQFILEALEHRLAAMESPKPYCYLDLESDINAACGLLELLSDKLLSECGDCATGFSILCHQMRSSLTHSFYGATTEAHAMKAEVAA